MSTTPVAPSATHHAPSEYTSQSECKLAQDCGLSWFAQWFLGFKAPESDNPAMRVGTLGHACLAEYVLGVHQRREWSMHKAMAEKARDKGYITKADDDRLGKTDGLNTATWPLWADDNNVSDELYEQARRARDASHTLIESKEWDLDPALLAYATFGTPTPAPLVECRLGVPWGALEANAGLVLPAQMLATFRGLNRPTSTSIKQPHRRGIEGTPDVVHWADADHSRLYVDDYKFRTRPVDDAPPTYAVSVPDAQGAFYKTLLAGLLVDEGAADVVFRQVNVYAGPWRTLDDFLEPGSPYVIDSGLPSRDFATLRGMVRADVWSEAWRLLAERRRIATLDRRGGPRVATVAETDNARRFHDDLERRSPVSIVATPRLDPSVCLEVVRDMLAPVAALLAQTDAGVTPGRHLRSWQSSPCMKPGGCRVQAPCIASLGSNNAASVFADHARSGHLTHLSLLPQVAEYDPEEVATP